MSEDKGAPQESEPSQPNEAEQPLSGETEGEPIRMVRENPRISRARTVITVVKRLSNKELK